MSHTHLTSASSLLNIAKGCKYTVLDIHLLHKNSLTDINPCLSLQLSMLFWVKFLYDGIIEI
jgi:hypothetical protein